MPPPPWAAGPDAAPIAAPPPPGPARQARGAGRVEPPLEIVRTHGEGEPSGWSTEVRLHSTGAPLGAVLTELARTVRGAIVVDPELAPRAVVAHVEAASAESIALQLTETLGGTLVRHGDIVVVTTHEAAMREVHERLVSAGPEPLETRVFSIDHLEHARQLAVVYCHLQASPRGGAALLGNHLVVRDGRSELDQLEALVTSLTAHEQSSSGQQPSQSSGGEVPPTP